MNRFIKTIALLSVIAPFSSMAAIVPISDVSQLDFDGNFDYAINFDGFGTQTIGDATFTNVSSNGTGSPAGVSVSGFNRDLVWAGANNLGASADNNALENVMSSIVWSAGLNPGTVDLDITMGINYRLQLLFSEGCCNNRHYKIDAEGMPTNEVIGTNIGGTWSSSSTQGYAVIYDFIATDTSLNVVLSRFGAQGDDTNYHISGITVERMTDNVSVPAPYTLAFMGLGLIGLCLSRKR